MDRDGDRRTAGGASGVQYTRRDLDVTIARSGDGFSITWTALIGKRGAGGNAEDRRKSNTLAFHRKGPNSFEAEGAIGTGLGKSYSWARLDGSSLIMYILEIDEDGVYEVSRYARTISRSGEMELRFIRHRDGQLVRHVSAVLTLAR